MESGIKEAIIVLLNEFAALINKANQLLDVVIRRETDQRPSSDVRRPPGVR